MCLENFKTHDSFLKTKNNTSQSTYCSIYSKCNLRHLKRGGERDRTDDLLLAKQALSQLSYTPNSILHSADDDWWARVDSNY